VYERNAPYNDLSALPPAAGVETGAAWQLATAANGKEGSVNPVRFPLRGLTREHNRPHGERQQGI
jgi:hypothetical protein